MGSAEGVFRCSSVDCSLILSGVVAAEDEWSPNPNAERPTISSAERSDVRILVEGIFISLLPLSMIALGAIVPAIRRDIPDSRRNLTMRATHISFFDVFFYFALKSYAALIGDFPYVFLHFAAM